jgi:hypothetical protein
MRYVEDLLRPDATVDDYGDSCVVSFDDSLSHRQYTVDKARWVIVSTRERPLATDDTAWSWRDNLYLRYENIGGICAVVSITPFNPDDSLQTGLPLMMGGYIFSNIVLNEPIDDAMFLHDATGTGYCVPGHAQGSPSSLPSSHAWDGRMLVLDLVGRTVPTGILARGPAQGLRIAVDPDESLRAPVIVVGAHTTGR